MENWSEGFEHASVTVENRAEFTKAMSKYPTEQDAIVGGYNAQKVAGVPYKIPESMDKLPDDNSRSEFRTSALKVLDMVPITSTESLKDFNFKEGMSDGVEADQGMIDAYTQHIIDTGKTPKMATADAKFFNIQMAKAGEAMKAKQEADAVAAAKACNEALIADPDIGSEAELLRLTELLTRAVKNDLGLSPDEVEEFADSMVGELTKNKVMAKAMLKLLAPLAAESDTEGGGGAGGGTVSITPYEWKKREWSRSESMWGKPEDTWENEPVSLRAKAKKAGIIK